MTSARLRWGSMGWGAVAFGAVLLCGGVARAATGWGAAVAESPAPARFALVIGNNQPEDAKIATLRYADDDAVSTHRLLTEAGVESVLLARLDDDTRRLEPNAAPAGPPRGQAFDAAVATLFGRMRARAARGTATELLIFYSGHGDVAAGEGYLVLEDRRVMRSDLYALLSRSPATRNHVFVDACKSYFIAFGKGPGGQRTSYTGAFLPAKEPGRLQNVGFVLSTSSDRDSHEWERYQAGILSHEVRSALRGAADADGDGRVTYAELGAFLSTANRAIANPRFRPDFLVRAPGRNLRQEVLRWTGHASTIHVAAGPLGHIYVENARGERVVDAHPAPKQALRLHVPPERPIFVRRHDETAESVVSSVEPTIVASLEPRQAEIARKGALQLAFDQLFATPFDAGDVDGFARSANDVDLQVVASPAPEAPERPRWIKPAAAGVAIAGAAAGLGLNALAFWRYRESAGASQRDIESANQSVTRFNTASAVCYGVAAAAGLTWAWLRWSDARIGIAPIVPTEGGGFAASVGGSF